MHVSIVVLSSTENFPLCACGAHLSSACFSLKVHEISNTSRRSIAKFPRLLAESEERGKLESFARKSDYSRREAAVRRAA